MVENQRKLWILDEFLRIEDLSVRNETYLEEYDKVFERIKGICM